MFDTKMHFKSFIEIGVGDVSASVVDKRGIAQKVLIFNATAFVLVHNHPSGDSTPSVVDIATAKTISELGDAGSTNQRVIDVQKSLRTRKVILKGE